MTSKGKTWDYTDTVIDDKGRTCRTCSEYKLYEHYHIHSNCPNGYNTVCKDCRKITSKNNYRNKSLEYNIVARAKARAAKRGIPFNIDESDIIVPDVCPVLGIPLKGGKIGGGPNSPSIDRTDSDKGYVKGNVTIMSNRANTLKNNGTIEEFEMLLKYLKECEVVDLT